MDSRKNDINNVIKVFEEKTKRTVSAIYDGGKYWLINSKPKGAVYKFSLDPFYTVSKSDHSVNHFDPCSASVKDKLFYRNALKHQVYKEEISKEEEERLNQEFQEELAKIIAELPE